MPELTGQPIVTNYGKQQILASTMDITRIKLGSGIWTPTAADTALNTEESSVAATGAVVPIPAGGSRLHINGQDAGGGSYDLHEFALTDDTDQALVIYSQAAIIDTKGGASTLVFAADIVIEQAGAGTINISGVTDFDLPQSSEVLRGIIEIATDVEVDAGVDTTRALTPKHIDNIEARIFENELAPIAHVKFSTGAGGSIRWSAGPAVVSYTTNDTVGVLVQFASDLVTTQDDAIVHASVDNPGTFVNLGQTRSYIVLPALVGFQIWNNVNQFIDLSTNTMTVGLTVYGARP